VIDQVQLYGLMIIALVEVGGSTCLDLVNFAPLSWASQPHMQGMEGSDPASHVVGSCCGAGGMIHFFVDDGWASLIYSKIFHVYVLGFVTYLHKNVQNVDIWLDVRYQTLVKHCTNGRYRISYMTD
jgi:hypothetical protein